MLGIGVNLRTLRSSVAASAISAYYAGGIKPGLVFDFENEKYFTDSLATTFDSAITHSRSGNATMVDSDGLLKWAPHNLLTYSEDFSNASWLKSNVTVAANVAVAPDGTLTADEANFTSAGGLLRQNGPSVLVGQRYTIGLWLKANTARSIDLIILFSSGGLGFSALTCNLTDEWQYFTVSNTVPAGTPDTVRLRLSSTEVGSIYVWGAHTYRSDLGGMVNNPDTGNSYVPTTSAARYLPRRGHHVYNGTSWVNEGVLVESEARTNLITYSTPDNTNWGKGGVVVTENVSGQTAPDGEETFTFFREDTGTVVHFLSTPSISFTTGLTYTFSAFVKKATTDDLIQLTFPGAAFGSQYANFNANTGEFESVSGVATNFENVGNGIYRVSITATATSTASGSPGFVLTNNDDSLGRTPIYTGDGINGFYVWGAQLE